MDQKSTVLFVCEHGSAKSIVAAAHFNRLAIERQVGLRAVSKGTNPDAEVAPCASLGLAADGLEVNGQIPARLAASDVESAVRVIAFCRLSQSDAPTGAIDLWDDVPAVSEGYEKARTAIVERIESLLDELLEPERGATGGLAP